MLSVGENNQTTCNNTPRPKLTPIWVFSYTLFRTRAKLDFFNC